MRRNGLRVALGALALVAAVGACGGGDDDGGGDGGTGASPVDGGRSGETVVELRNLKFDPAEVTVGVGETVVWKWDDGNIAHNVVHDDFKSDLMTKGEFEHTFDEAGTFEYVCTVHPGMTGEVVVE